MVVALGRDVVLTLKEAGACSVTVAVLVFDVSVLLVAVTVAVVVLGIDEGAVYSPAAEMVPAVAVHVAPWFSTESPVTVAVKVWVPLAESVTVDGLTVTAIGVSVTVAVAVLVVSVLLVAMMVALVVDPTGVGAV